MTNEICIVPTFNRHELLHCCLTRIRRAEPKIRIAVFPDRGTYYDSRLREVVADAGGSKTCFLFVPNHDFYGNSYNVMEAFRWAFNEGYTFTYLIEDDVMIHPDFFRWHREQHEERDDIFASMGWVFNRYAPFLNDVMYAPWYYSIGNCFRRSKLELVVRHATPRYYEDMAGYVGKEFEGCMLNRSRPQFGIEHFEQDGLIQRVMDLDKTQCASPSITKCDHMGLYGYNRGWRRGLDLFDGCESFSERISRLEDFIADPYERAEVFGRDIVEREIGHLLPRRDLRYLATLPGGYHSEFVTERLITPKNQPTYVNSVRVDRHMIIEKIS